MPSRFDEYLFEFYRELDSVLAAIEIGTVERTLGASTETRDAATEAHLILAQLRGILHERRRRFEQIASPYELAEFDKVEYACASFADEKLLEAKWDGASIWPQLLVERSLYKTAISGKRVFSLIDETLASSDMSETARSVAKVYLTLLQLGFRGQFDSNENEKRLTGYRKRLVQFLGVVPEVEQSNPLFDRAYRVAATIGADLREAPSWRHWMIVAVVGYLLASTAVWLMLVYRVQALGGL